MNILGIQKDHNSAACLFKDEELIYYNQEERLSRIKKDNGIPFFCLKDIVDICPDIDVLLISGYDFIDNENHSIISLIQKLGFKFNRNFIFKPYYKSHHLMHAANAFYNSGFENSLVLVYDGKGSTYNLSNGKQANETTSVFSVSYPDKFNLLYRRLHTRSQIDESTSVMWDDSFVVGKTPTPRYVNKNTKIEIRNDYDVGFMYEGTCRSLKFDDEGGKMMGLQSYGTIDTSLPPALNDKNQFNMSVFKFNEMDKHLGFDTLTYPELNNEENMTNFARSVQIAFETIGLNLIEKMLAETGHTNLIITGGAALNVVANYHYRKNLPDNISMYIEPVCGDEGNCIGMCRYFLKERTQSKSLADTLGVYIVGKQPEYNIELKHDEIILENIDEKYIANLLYCGNIVVLFQGKAEAGPRALGNRSLLFDPRIPDGKDIVNIIKRREKFRPFAASVMQEHASEWFDLRNIDQSPHMMYAVDARVEKSKFIPAVIHVDNTCRVQTVAEEQNQSLYNILKEFYNITKIPMLLNTSFNLAGDPIVHTINDAITSLRKSGLEYLYLPDIKKLIYIKNY